MKVQLIVLRKNIFYFLFWWNIWRNMTSDTRVIRVLLLKSKHTQFSYTCVGWINSKPRQSLHVLLLIKFINCRTFFCFFNFCPKILNTLHQIYTTFQIFEVIHKYSLSFDIFCGQTIKRNLKLLMFCASWFVCIAETNFLFSVLMDYLTKYDVRYSLISCPASEIETYMQFSYTCLDWIKRSQDNLFMVFLLKKFIVCRTFFYFFHFCPKILNTLHQIVHDFSNFEENIQVMTKFRPLFSDKPSKET